MENNEEYKKIAVEYEKYEEVIIGKLDQKDQIKKQAVLLGISRYLFTHSLPLIAAEQCYIYLIKQARNFLTQDSNKSKRNRSFEIIIDLMEEYNIKLLSTKVYWDKPEEREEYKKFWDKYKGIDTLEEIEKNRQREIIFLKYDLKKLYRKGNKYKEIIKIYKNRLVEIGAMKEIRNSFKTQGRYVKAKDLPKVS